MKEIAKNYNAQEFEQKIYKKWEDSGFFNPDNLRLAKKDYFSISLPPPNATGVLHLGHAVMLAYQDVLIRYHRMLGENTLWVPGTDHAAIATQNKVEKMIADESGQKKEDLGREKFLERVRDYVAGSQDTIRNQIRRMGSSIDWSRERYTFSDSLSQAVNMAFKKMYNDGLIYRGYRIVNWCPRCHSTLSDDEVEYQEQQGKMYYFKYGPVKIATTRPETKIGDTGLAVHPNDERYKKYIGQTLEFKLGDVKLKVKVFADSEVDPDFGTGAIGVTPAHSAVDYAWAQKYDLEIKKIINEDGKMTAAAGPYQDLTVVEARDKFVQAIDKAGQLIKIEDYNNNLSICYRCNTAIEPLTSEQWFVDINKKIPSKGKSLKEMAIEVVASGRIEIIPEKFHKVYDHWMNNLHDWCISRQIWWGHRIPVWYQNNSQPPPLQAGSRHRRGEADPPLAGKLKTLASPTLRRSGQNSKPDLENIYVGVKPPEGEGWVQDEDTLDTWFSSALWTFSTLLDQDYQKYNTWEKWLENSPDLKKFHPTSIMETGYDIIFFWVARMIIMTTYLLDDIPFKKVYLHGLIRDKQGRKMSKSLGNGIDPIEMINKFGADALRLSMMVGSSPGNDMRLYEEKVEGYRNFINKLWNISRYILGSVQEIQLINNQPMAKSLADAWILRELEKLISEVTNDLDKFRFSPAIEKLYEFTWSKFADWYIEISKIEAGKDEILLYVLQQLLKLWHPFAPYVTEVIWGNFNNGLLLVSTWPIVKSKCCFNFFKKSKFNPAEFDLIQNLISTVRNAKVENKVDPAKILNCQILGSEKVVNNNRAIIEKLARLKLVDSKADNWLELAVSGLTIAIDIDKNEAIKLRQKQQQELEGYIVIQTKKLANENFVSNAPAEVVEQERNKLQEAQNKLARLI